MILNCIVNVQTLTPKMIVINKTLFHFKLKIAVTDNNKNVKFLYNKFYFWLVFQENNLQIIDKVITVESIIL